MIRYDEALAIIRALPPFAGTERLPLAACPSRRLAADLHARVPSPPYTNSAMDGFAVRRADLGNQPKEAALFVSGTVYARPLAPGELPVVKPGTAVRIMTGGFLPEGADTVIPVEDSEIDAQGHVRFTALPETGANIRRRGDDLAEGALLLKAGARLIPERIMVAAAFGHRELDVQERPELVLFATGDELTEPGEALAPGAIYNSSKYFLLAAADAAGFKSPRQETLPDDEARAEKAVRGVLDAGRATLLVTTGAVSAGEADFIPQLGAQLGFKALFHKVAIRPGKPVYLAVKDRMIWLGLPGNPLSTAVGWHIFARPLLEAVAGIPAPVHKTLVLANEVRKPEGLRCYYRAEVTGDKAWVAMRQGSAELAASISNEAYVELPEGFSRIPAETRVSAIMI